MSAWLRALGEACENYLRIAPRCGAASCLIWLAWAGIVCAQPRPGVWELGPTGTKANLRSVHAVNDRVLWACGSQATVLSSGDGGSSWRDCSPEGYGQLEFRSLHAWDERSACIASAGSPAVIVRTEDAGASWQEVYRHSADTAFIDGLKFWDRQRGIAFGDPLAGTILMLLSDDSGLTWRTVPPEQLPAAEAGEAGFAASNSAMHLAAGGRVWIGCGGSERGTSRLYYRQGWAAPWSSGHCPLPSSATAGIFSLAAGRQLDVLVAVGGDYRPGQSSPATAAYSRDGGVTWRRAQSDPGEYRSAVVRLPERFGEPKRFGGENPFVATGPSGSDYSSDGLRWETFSEFGFHALAVSATQVFAVGGEGRFAVLRPPTP